ncbi:zinc finger protein 420-like isoform X2 [Ambystoma mexicanum]|uniref:zinc finger protein 420-like isoform X2 n=1 Tax=Ambystoma mexicanum TaxID=8296 RepID=UPI0037E9A44E
MSKRLPVQASVTFHDVAVYFMEEEWGRLEERQKQRYREVMEEIHEALFSLGYSIINPDVLIRIKAGKGPDLCDRRVPKGRQRRSGRAAAQSGCILPGKEEEDPGSTDDFCFVKSGRRALFSGDTDDDEVTPDMLFRVKEEPEPYSIVPEESDEGDCMDGLSANDPEDDSELVIIVKKEPCDVELNNRDVIGIPAEGGGSVIGAKDMRSTEERYKDLTPDELQTEKTPQVSHLPAHTEQNCCPSEKIMEYIGSNHRGGILSDNSVQPPFVNEDDAEAKPPHTESPLTGKEPVASELCNKPFSSGTQACRGQRGYGSQLVYKCRECEKTFSKNSNLLRHHRIHTGERPYDCSECDKSFLQKSSLTQHLRLHTDERPFKCTECEKSFRLSSTLVYHLTTHRVEKLFKCTECEKSFTLKATLVNHVRVHTGERPFKCTDCEKCFISFRNLQRHQRVHTGEQPYTCPVCPKRFSNVSNQRRHLKTHTAGGGSVIGAKDMRSTEECYKDLMPDELQTEKAPQVSQPPAHTEQNCCPSEKMMEYIATNHRGGILSDNSVQPPFVNEDGAEAKPPHIEGSQTGKEPVAWELCNKPFSSGTQACRGQGGYGSQLVYKCRECEKTFSKNSNLLRHHRIHTGERPYDCSECDKSFLQKSSLTQHLRLHTGERPYKCTECEKSFRLSSTLVYHLTTHRVEKLFKCTECEKSFTLKATLLNHMRVHTGERPFNCTDCEKCFINFRNLQKHKRVHTGEQPYTCPVCPKRFSNVSNQRRHLKTHTGEKPVHCPQCKRFFSHRSSLIKHQQMQRCNRQQNYNSKNCDKKFTSNALLIQHMRTHMGERPFK